MLQLKKLKDEEQKLKAQKLDNYSKYVKEMYWPKLSPKKQLELEIIRNTI